MTSADYFGDDSIQLVPYAGAIDDLARRQFVFSLVVGGLLLAVAALISLNAAAPNRSRVALHHMPAASAAISPKG
jgi:hypothetical protein